MNKEYFEQHYYNIHIEEFISGAQILDELRHLAFGSSDKCENEEACSKFCKICSKLYKKLEPVEKQIEEDWNTYKEAYGFAYPWYMDGGEIKFLRPMLEICKLYHHYYSYIILYGEDDVVKTTETISGLMDNGIVSDGQDNTEKVMHEVHKKDTDLSKSNPTDNMAKTDKASAEVSDNKNDYSSVIMEWREEYNKKYKQKSIKTFIPFHKLTEEEIKTLVDGLIKMKFIDKTTEPERFVHILSGEIYDGEDPVMWIKKTSRNQLPSKRSVLNFLRLLGVKWDNITHDRLSCCFLCSKEESYQAFEDNNIKVNGKKVAKSEFNGDLKSIIESALGKDHIICCRMQTIPLNE